MTFKVTVHTERRFEFSVCNFVNMHRTPTTYIQCRSQGRGRGVRPPPPPITIEIWREKSIIDEFPIYMSKFSKLDAFGAISGIKISKIFGGFPPDPTTFGAL